jgi:hypothetical protein
MTDHHSVCKTQCKPPRYTWLSDLPDGRWRWVVEYPCGFWIRYEEKHTPAELDRLEQEFSEAEFMTVVVAANARVVDRGWCQCIRDSWTDAGAEE